jgi:hypothetical protein
VGKGKGGKKKKKKNPDINQCGEKGSGVVLHTRWFHQKLSVPGIISRIKYGYGRTYLPTQQTRQKRAEKKQKNLGINPRQRHLKYTEAGSVIKCKSRIITSQTDQRN